MNIAAGACSHNSMAALDHDDSTATMVSPSTPQQPAAAIRSSAASSVPNSPARSIRKPDDYGDTLEMYDSPRHSHESSVSLLHGQHSRNSSAGSFDSFVAPERSFAPGLASLAEEDNIAIYDENGDFDNDDEFPHAIERRNSLHSKIQSDAATVSGGSNSKRKRTRHRKRSSVVPVVVQESASKAAIYVKENRGLLMIAASQAAFAAMNAMVSSSSLFGYPCALNIIRHSTFRARQITDRGL